MKFQKRLPKRTADKADVEGILQCKGIDYGCTHARHDAKHKPKDKIYD
jgi:hypothetical protein